MTHQTFLDIACNEAKQAQAQGESAVGAVLVKAGEVVAQSHDRRRALNDPVAVAELDCIRRAGRRNDQAALTLYTTRYPDRLSVGTILQFSIGHIVIGLPPLNTPMHAQADDREKPPGLSLLREKQVAITFIAHTGCQSLATDNQSTQPL